MSVKIISESCPACGAALDIEDGRDYVFCSYCGTRVTVHDDNEVVHHHIDEAEIKQAETDRIIQLKKMELAVQKRISEEKQKAFKIRLSIILGAITIVALGIGFSFESAAGLIGVGFISGFILMWIWLIELAKDDDDNDSDYFEDKVKIPSGVLSYQTKNYATIKELFVDAGFTNIKCVPLNDLTFGLLKKPGTVESITVNGHLVTGRGKKYSPNVPVIISYHSGRQNMF